MDRPTILVSLVAAVLAAVGQEPAAVAQDVRYTIAGDVAQPDSYNFPAGQPVYLLDLLQSSGSQFAEGSAVILRDSPPRPIGSEFVRPGQSDRGSMLAPGDIVILHRGAGMMERGNAVLVTDDLPIVLQFDGMTSSVAGLLERVQTFVPAVAEIPAFRTARGRAAQIFVTPATSLQHGDVLMLSSVVPVSGLRISETFNSRPPTWQQGGSGPGLSFASMPQSKWGDATNQPESAKAQPLVAVPASSSTSPPVTTASLQSQPAATAGSGSLLIPGLPGSSTGPAGATTLPIPDSGADAAAFSLAENSTATSAQSTTELQSAAAESAAAAEAMNTSAGRSLGGSNSSFWNFVFVAGLMISMILVIVGWLKTRAEQDRMRQLDSALRTSINSLRLKDVEGLREEPLPNSSLQQYLATTTETKTLATQTGSETEPAQFVSAAMQDQPVPLTRPQEDQPVTRPQEDLPVMNSSKNTPSRALVGEQEWFGGEWISGAEQTASARSTPEPTVTDAATAAEGSAAEGSSTTTMAQDSIQADEIDDTLEAMIQNRLPLRLQTTDLPLKIAFFGRPAGPRRLRIDAAHERVPAPHIKAGASTGRRMTQPATANTSPDPASTKRPVTVTASAGNPAAQSAPSVSSNPLDQALNSLQESSES